MTETELKPNNLQLRRGCLFCRYESTKPDDLVKHLFDKHHFTIGNPKKLVFIPEFLDQIENLIQNLICPYCEKIFHCRQVLGNHMRKKFHKRVDPKNRRWKQFYLGSHRNRRRRQTRESRRGEGSAAEDSDFKKDQEDLEMNCCRVIRELDCLLL